MNKENQKKSANSRNKKGVPYILTSFPYSFIIISVLTFIVYYQVLSFGLIDFDDKRIIESAVNLGSNQNLSTAFEKDPYFNSDQNSQFYRPIQNLSILIDASLNKKDFTYFHLTNLLIHIFTVFCIFYLLTQFKYDRFISLLLALIFSLHPLFSFNVVWIPARGDLLVSLFSLLSLIYFIKFLHNKRIIFILLNTLCFALALFSKEIAIVLPVIYIIYYYLFSFKNEQKPDTSFDIVQFKKIFILILWLITTLAYFFLKNIFLHKSIGNYTFGVMEFINNLRYYPEYILKFLVPINLTGMYQFTMLSTLLGILIIIIIITIFILKYKRIDISKSIFFYLWFTVFLIPIVAFKQSYIPSLEYWEHRSYLPLIGIVFLLAELLKMYKFKTNRLLIISSIVLVIFIPYTIISSQNYSQSFKFFDNIIAKGTTLPNAYFSRGTIRKTQGDLSGALFDLNKAIELNNNYFEAFFERGVVKQKSNKLDGAIKDFTRAIELKPSFEDTYFNLGICYYLIGNFNNSIIYFRRSIELNPNDQRAKELLNNVMLKVNQQ